jgi:hypothetical protein
MQIKSCRFEILVERPVLEAWGPMCTHDWELVDYQILSINTKYDIKVVTADKNGQLLTTGGGLLSAVRSEVYDKAVSHTTAVQPVVRDNRDGTYTVTLRPDHLGDFSLLISMNGLPIQNGRIGFAVRDADSDKTFAAGPGLTSAVVGSQTEFTVSTRTSAGDLVDLVDARRSLQVRSRSVSLQVLRARCMVSCFYR